jgi:hypothetical protein
MDRVKEFGVPTAYNPLEGNTDLQKQCFLELIQDPAYEDINHYFDPRDAANLMPILGGYKRLDAPARALMRSVIEFYLSDLGYKSGVVSMCRSLNIDKFVFEQRVVKQWPEFWPFVSLLISRKIQNSKHRVDSATLEAAVNGSHQDRRLFYEVFGDLKREESRGSGTTLIFVNDAMHRPVVERGASEATIVDVTKVEDSTPQALEALKDL